LLSEGINLTATNTGILLKDSNVVDNESNATKGKQSPRLVANMDHKIITNEKREMKQYEITL